MPKKYFVGLVDLKYAVCLEDIPPGSDGTKGVAEVLAKLGPSEVSKQRATLFAAAADLLASLEELVSVPNKHRPEQFWQDARDAIAKARKHGAPEGGF